MSNERAMAKQASNFRPPRELRELLETLPQEIYNDIYDLTFTAEPGVRDLGYISRRVPLGGPYGRPKDAGKPFLGSDNRGLLQVDRASREKFAQSYYGGEDAVFVAQSGITAGVWLDSLEWKHEALIRYTPEIVKSDARLDWY